MAINYLAKLVESTATTNPNTVTLTTGCAAGSLVVIALSARRSGASPGIVSVTDSQGNTYTVYDGVSYNNSRAAIAYCRTPVALAVGDTITVTWNGALTDSWVSAHAFENAAGTAHHTAYNYGTSSVSPQVTLNVSGSDWLTFGNFYWGAGSKTSITITPANSSVSRDSVTSYFSECFSRNGTTGSTHAVGGTTVDPGAWSGAGASFLFESGSSGNARYQPTVIGV